MYPSVEPVTIAILPLRPSLVLDVDEKALRPGGITRTRRVVERYIA